MLSTARGFLNRHRRKFLIGGLMIGGIVVLTKYSRRKIREWQENEVRELLQRTRRSQHFEATERSCDRTIIKLSVCVRNAVVKASNSESVVEKLRKGRTDDKIADWNELKCLAITRTAVVIYSTTMLVVSLRIQLSLLGGMMFKNSQNPDDTTSIVETDTEEYLVLLSYLMSDGIEKLTRYVREKVDEIASKISLVEKLALHDLEQIYRSIVTRIAADTERDPVRNFASYVMSEDSRNAGGNPPLRAKLIRETIDLLESEEVQSLTSATIRSGFALLVDHISEYFVDPSRINDIDNAEIGGKRQDEYSNCLNIHRIKMPMAKLIPIINGQVRDSPTSGDIAATWLRVNMVDEKLNTLAANIYEAFSF